MSETKPCVNDEIDDHKSEIDVWVNEVKSLEVSDSYKGVISRFVRDCDQFKAYLDENATPRTNDLIDFTDRKNSLQSQYFNITEAVGK